MVEFSQSLVAEYQAEMLASYGVSVSDADAQIHLRSLVRSMFPNSKKAGALSGALAPTCDGFEVGASITPTSGHRDK